MCSLITCFPVITPNHSLLMVGSVWASDDTMTHGTALKWLYQKCTTIKKISQDHGNEE